MKENPVEAYDKNLFNRIAHKYAKKDINNVSSLARQFQLNCLFNEINRFCLRKHQNRIIVELGCGVGASANYLFNQYDQYLGIDYSEELISIAKNTYADKKRSFICANIKDFKLSDENLDVVFGVGVLHHVQDLDLVLKNLYMIGNPETIFGFIEPQGANKTLQFIRRLRMFFDRGYSKEQIFFKDNDIQKLFNNNNFDILSIRYQGFLTPPFAQVILKPSFIFHPLLKLSIKFDRFVQSKYNSKLAWNIIWVARKRFSDEKVV